MTMINISFPVAQADLPGFKKDVENILQTRPAVALRQPGEEVLGTHEVTFKVPLGTLLVLFLSTRPS